MAEFAGRTVLITGAAQGMGYACAQGLIERGGNAVMLDLNAEGVATAAAEFGDRALSVSADITDRRSIEAALQSAVDKFGAVDGLINCAAAGWKGDYFEMTEADFEATLRLDVTGTYIPADVVARYLIDNKRPGTIVAVSSVQSVVASPDLVAYSAAKAGVSGLVRALAVTFAPHQVRVNAVAPGPMATPMLLKHAPHGSDAAKAMLARTPLGRFAEPSEMADAALYLAGPHSSFITGQILFCDGGRTVLNFTMPEVA